jgi:hypothetical protein
MKVLIACANFGNGDQRAEHVGELRRILSTKKALKTEWLTLPFTELSLDELLSIRMLPVGEVADILLAMDLTSTVLRHPRKITLLRSEPSPPEERLQAHSVLMRGLSESELILVENGKEDRYDLPAALAGRTRLFRGSEASNARSSHGTLRTEFSSLLKELSS